MTGACNRKLLDLNCEAEADRIAGALRGHLARDLRRRGLVVALSGGVDSSVVGALCVRAVGAKKVCGLLLPERESAPEATALGRRMAEHLGIVCEEVDITGVLEALGCYQRRDDAVRGVVPEYGAGWKCGIVLPSYEEERGGYRLFSLVVQPPGGERRVVRLPLNAYLEIVAATSFKQRTRKMMEYYYADRMHYAVAGTPNRQEYDQGFFVKLGDGAADVKPIAHLYKTQVYQLAEFLEIPREIRGRAPATDTYPLGQTQEEFYFSLRYDKLDLCLYGRDHGTPESEVAAAVGMSVEQVRRVYRDIDAKRAAAAYLHLPPLLMEQETEAVPPDPQRA